MQRPIKVFKKTLKAKLKALEATQNYFMVKNVKKKRKMHSKLYPKRVHILMESGYLSRESFAILFIVEQDIHVH